MQCVLIVLTMLTSPISRAASPETFDDDRFKTITISAKDLNKRLEPFGLFVDIQTTGNDRERWVKCIILRDSPISSDDTILQGQLRYQVKPRSYFWEFDGRKWRMDFLLNRDGTHHTVISMPVNELKQSKLRILIEELSKGGPRKDFTIVIDMADFQWKPSTSWTRQGQGAQK